mmetsp:Transcript_21704/g.15546  ORF Transcript_21704/g.15546 Transcript_21704/m.15546 type:complete len:136 (-) Transcript_21704:537-944(-)
MRTPGVFEIKFHNPKAKNSFGSREQLILANLFEYASNNSEIKVVMMYGSMDCFSAGNDLKPLMKAVSNRETSKEVCAGVLSINYKMLKAMLDCKKPIVAVVRGKAVGISFTMLNYADFVYCTEDALFWAPFMATA